MQKNNYDSRWFIWTIVFLVVTGISLVSYIALSGNPDADNSAMIVARTAVHKAVTPPAGTSSSTSAK
jgi:hypothetical protein